MANSAQNSTAADSAAAIEAVQRAVALVRTATSKLRNPLPASSNNLTGGFLTSLLAPVQQQQSLLEFNPLDAKSFAELATQAAKPAMQQAPPSRSAAQDNFVNAIVAATAKAAQKSTAKAIAAQTVSQAATGAASKATPQKFSLVKPSLQDVNAQLIDVWDKISQAAPSPELKKLADNNRRMLQQINNAIAPRAAAGHSGGATLGKLLQQIGELTDEGIVSLVQGRGAAGMIEDAFGSKGKPARSAPTPPPALVKLAEIVGDVWEQTFPTSDAQMQHVSTAKKARSSAASSPKTNAPGDECAAASATADLVSAAPNPKATAPVSNTNTTANVSAAPLDMSAIANGINEVLREQAWLAGVDLT